MGVCICVCSQRHSHSHNSALLSAGATYSTQQTRMHTHTHACTHSHTHTHTHTHNTHTHNHWRSANFLLVVVCVCDDGVYKYICFTQVWSGDPLLTSEWYNLVVACSVQYLLLPDLLTTLLLCIASLFAALCLVVCAVSVCSSS